MQVRREAGEPVLGQGPLAAIDNLTMLYTRRHLHEVANAEAQRAAARTLQEIAARREATACRYGGSCLALVVPDIDEDSAELLAAETAGEIGRGSRTAAAAWRPGETGDAVVACARADLRS